jgi:divalent metal cation (Fe/Co/Zn/Cd) transporter
VESIVQLILYFVVFMVAGDIAEYFIGLVVEHVWPQASLLAFLLFYFVSLWVAWRLAVKVTEPKDTNAPAV